MTSASRKLLFGITLWLAGGTLIGWLYGHAERGLLIASLLLLAWQVRNLVAFDRALATRNFEPFRSGEGIWQQMFARFSYERQRGDRYKRQQRQLIREIRNSTDAMPDGAVIVNRQNEIISCNRAAKSLAGLKPRKDRGQRLDNILRDPGLAQLLQGNDATQTVDLESPLREGEWINCRAVPYGSDNKLVLIRDVTDRMRLNKMRRDFVANASHELRSPLTVISGYLDSLAGDDKVPPDLRKPLLQMQGQAHRMTSIIADLLELSRLEVSGKATTDELVDVAGLADAACRTFRELDDSPAIEGDFDDGIKLLGSDSEIQSLLANLLSNAVRHTGRDGTVVVSWRANGDGASLLVRDTGEGIAAEHIPRLTERFFRVDRGRARADGGVGLGLAIVKHVLERHDAVLRISSDYGSGSEFACEFPCQRVRKVTA